MNSPDIARGPAQLLFVEFERDQPVRTAPNGRLDAFLPHLPRQTILVVSLRFSSSDSGFKKHQGLALERARAARSQMIVSAAIHDNLSKQGRTGAQILLSTGDLESPVRFQNLRSTLGSLLDRGIVPVVSWNYAVLHYKDDVAWNLETVLNDILAPQPCN